MENETKLFPDSETFVKERPLKLTEKQAHEFYLRMAKEVVNNGWANDDPDDIAEDLEDLSCMDNGFEKAKDLDFKGYEIDAEFVEWLNSLDYHYRNELEVYVKIWVKAHDIQPKFKVKDSLIMTAAYSKFKPDDIIYINNIYPDTALYVVDTDPERKGGCLIAFEKIEANCIQRPF